jgi:hypothetical protein
LPTKLAKESEIRYQQYSQITFLFKYMTRESFTIGNNLIYYFEKPDQELRKGLLLNCGSEKLKAVREKRGLARQQRSLEITPFMLLNFGIVAM